MRHDYTVRYAPNGAGWLAYLAEEQDVESTGRTLAKAETAIRTALGQKHQADAAAVTLRPELVLHTDVVNAIVRAKHAREAARRADDDARLQTAFVLRALNVLGVSRRDTAWILGISHQRVQQLTSPV